MNEVLAISLHAMQSDMARVEQVGMNLANALTPGYKRRVAVQAPTGASFAARMVPAAAAATPADVGSAAAGPVRLHSDFRAGTLKRTGQSLDLALAGPGYFEVRTAEGVAYTRNGSFRVDAAGRVVTAQGHAVMGQAGEITLPSTGAVVTAAGAVIPSGGSAQAPLAHVRLVRFDSDATLQPLGDGLFAAPDDSSAQAAAGTQVRQGWLENANVAPATEMTQLVRALRHFEAMHKVAQGCDEMLGTAIRRLGETR